MMKLYELRDVLNTTTVITLLDNENCEEIEICHGTSNLPSIHLHSEVHKVVVRNDSLFVYIEMPEWRVEATVTATVYVTVKAPSEDDALIAAEESVGVCCGNGIVEVCADGDADIDVDYSNIEIESAEEI